eukprot:CAMPEP_0204330820 /NCGR_PEP_ID=MMETSP0469-20131031/15228_1 /ASSEMBLY_ACC=CAM_ASM_000384 /TAXON_ID=2969 /ORGANISM="Oxyrrhis marina" /LENGTH=203 /DNA_ID=CAMNT_0051313695 /DNA_START=54 /DNA_END=665 /DNA_ORIENTATION=+
MRGGALLLLPAAVNAASACGSQKMGNQLCCLPPLIATEFLGYWNSTSVFVNEPRCYCVWPQPLDMCADDDKCLVGTGTDNVARSQCTSLCRRPENTTRLSCNFTSYCEERYLPEQLETAFRVTFFNNCELRLDETRPTSCFGPPPIDGACGAMGLSAGTDGFCSVTQTPTAGACIVLKPEVDLSGAAAAAASLWLLLVSLRVA